MPERGGGIVRVRNEAFRILSDLLDLPGGVDSLQHIDLDRAVPSLDLQNLIEEGLAGRWVYSASVSVLAGAFGGANLDFWDTTGWTTIRNPAAASAVPPFDWDVAIRFIGCQCASSDVVESVVRLDGSALSPAQEVLIWDAGTRNGLGHFHGNGQPPNVVRLPLIVDRLHWDQVELRADNTGGVANTVHWNFDVVGAPRGVLSIL